MAIEPTYGLKYELHGKSVPFGKNWKVRIAENGYVGAQINRNVPTNPFVLKKDSAGTIRGTSLQFSIRAIADFEFIELYTNNSRDWLIQLIDNLDSIVWQGYILPEEYQEAYSPAPVTVCFTATDQLGLLKNYTYTAAGSTRQSLLKTINDCLTNTGLSLEYAIALSIKESRQDPARSILAEIYDNPEIYNGMTCYDVVVDILSHFDADITQNNGKWLIRGAQDKLTDRLIYDNMCAYTSVIKSAPILQSLGRYGIADAWVTGSPLALTLVTANRILSISETYLTKTSIVPNPLPIWGDNNFVPPDGWTTHINANMIKSGTDNSYFMVTAKPGYMNTYGYAEVSVPLVKATTELIQFSFDFAYIIPVTGGITDLTKERAQLFVSCRLFDPISGTTRSLTKDGWSTNTFLHVSESLSIPTNGNYLQAIDWKNFSVITNGIPVDGTLIFQFGNPHCAGYVGVHDFPASYWGAGYKNIVFNIFQDGKPLPAGLKYDITLNNSTKAAKKELKWTGGDVPIYSNSMLQLLAIWTLWDNLTITGLYNSGDIAIAVPLIDLISKQNASDNRRAKQKLTGSIRSQNLIFDMVYENTYPSTRKFEILEATYNLCEDKAEVTLLEILDYQEQSFTLVSGEYTGTLNTSSGSTPTVVFGATSPPVTIIPKAIFPFIAERTPGIPDYTLFKDSFGIYPVTKLYTVDASGNMIERSETAKIIIVSGVITSIIYDLVFAETGYIILS